MAETRSTQMKNVIESRHSTLSSLGVQRLETACDMCQLR